MRLRIDWYIIVYTQRVMEDDVHEYGKHVHMKCRNMYMRVIQMQIWTENIFFYFFGGEYQL